ncbi:MAG: HNH endonuclease [Chloroflexota bacterium]|nr:HNH endonuclease [Chloroflexota bacterium]
MAEQHGGKTTAENLALACIHCNRQRPQHHLQVRQALIEANRYP